MMRRKETLGDFLYLYQSLRRRIGENLIPYIILSFHVSDKRYMYDQSCLEHISEDPCPVRIPGLTLVLTSPTIETMNILAKYMKHNNMIARLELVSLGPRFYKSAVIKEYSESLVSLFLKHRLLELKVVKKGQEGEIQITKKRLQEWGVEYIIYELFNFFNSTYSSPI